MSPNPPSGSGLGTDSEPSSSHPPPNYILINPQPLESSSYKDLPKLIKKTKTQTTNILPNNSTNTNDEPFLPPLQQSYIPPQHSSQISAPTPTPPTTKPVEINFKPDLHLYWGDLPTTKHLQNSFIFRFLHYNTKGVKPATDDPSLEADLKIIKKLDPTIIGINEINFDTTKNTLNNAFKRRVRKTLGQNSTVELTSLPEPALKEHKMGGEALIA